ncbi:MAG: glycosyltransferase family 39 protein [Acetatifactor muris]|nr:glycosyltransferase family 39 protein [Acetatifactor muris]
MIDKAGDCVSRISRTIAFGIFGFICFYLFLLSIFSTCVIWYDTEGTYYLSDFPWLLMAGLAGMTGLFFLCRKFVRKILDRRMALMGGVTLVWLVLVIIFVANTDIEMIHDQARVYEAMQHLLDGDYATWQPGGYMYAYPFQNGLMILYLPLRIFFGDHTYLVIQGVNILFMELLAVGFYKLGKKYFGTNAGVLSYIGILFFLPLWGYIKYMYGNLPGISLAVWAIYLLTLFMEKGKWKHAAGSAFCILFACIYKSNFLIYLIAMAIVLLVDAMAGKKGKNIAAVLLLAGAAIVASKGPALLVHWFTGCVTDQGIPKIHWVTMGLHESYLAPGWYSGDAMKWYAENNFSREICVQDAWKSIRESLELFGREKEYCMRFFARKTASIWNNPTFECFAVVVKGNLFGTLEYWMKDILYSGGIVNTILTVIMDIMQSIYLFGTILYLMYCRKEKELQKAIPLVAFIGGVLMHTFWEGKCQYTIIYFVVLIPYAFAGYQECIRMLERRAANRTGVKSLFRSRAVWAFGILLAVILGISVSDNTVLNSTIKVGGDGGDYIWMCRECDYWRSDSFTKEGPREE